MATKSIGRLVKRKDWLTLGLGLRHRQENGLHPGSFRKYIEGLHAGFSYRTALFYIEMTRDMERLGYTEAQTRKMIGALGVSKVCIIFRHLRKKQLPASVIELYGMMSNPQIETLLKEDHKVNFSARISDDNHYRLMKLLEKHGAVNKPEAKARGVGPAFDAFLERYFLKTGGKGK